MSNNNRDGIESTELYSEPTCTIRIYTNILSTTGLGLRSPTNQWRARRRVAPPLFLARNLKTCAKWVATSARLWGFRSRSTFFRGFAGFQVPLIRPHLFRILDPPPLQTSDISIIDPVVDTTRQLVNVQNHVSG